MILWFWTPNYQNSLNRMHEPESSLRSLLACHSQNEQRPSYYVCFTLLYSLPSVSRLQLPFRFFYISLQTIPYRILLLCFLSRSLFLFLSMRRTEREKKRKKHPFLLMILRKQEKNTMPDLWHYNLDLCHWK